MGRVRNSKEVLAARVLEGAGFSRAEINRLFHRSETWATLALGPGTSPLPDYDRNAEIERLYREGNTLEDIGIKFGITRERVRQLLSKRGVTKHDGGAVLARTKGQLAEAIQRRQNRDDTAMRFYGCDRATLEALNGSARLHEYKGPAMQFYQQKRAAEQRGIGWELTFPQWYNIWQSSGHWHERGRGLNGYCMSRKGDTGPYSVDNVQIITNVQNIKESYRTRPASVRRKQRYARDALGMTPRQSHLWELFKSGLSNTDIAKRMGISRHTVASSLAAIKGKLGVLDEMYKPFSGRQAALSPAQPPSSAVPPIFV